MEFPPSQQPPPPTAAPSYPVQPQARFNGMAIASMVLGIIWIYWIGSILALVFGYIAKAQIEQSSPREQGMGMATAGIVLGWVGVGVLVTILVLLLVGVLTTSLFFW